MSEVLVVGSGGREAAIKDAVGASEEVERVVVDADPVEGLKQLSQKEKPLVVIGPEAPLVAGVADELREEGYPVFGVGREAARYEASKSFSTRMMREAGLAHPDTVIAESLEKVQNYVYNHNPLDIVIKADGLASGKGVVLPKTISEAILVAEGMIKGELFGGAGKEAVNFQQRNKGPEISATAVVGDNDEHLLLPNAQDHKRLLDGDNGPNTGGMGSYAPVPETILSPEQYRKVQEITALSLKGMREFGVPFERGTLYIGLMLSEQNNGDPTVIEYNVRFGDPETQVILPLAQRAGVDIYKLLLSAANGELEDPGVDMSKLALSAMSVCLAAHGYPESPRKGDKIWGLDQPHPGVDLQLAAVGKDNETTGGRVLYSTAVGKDIEEAASLAYGAIDLKREGPSSGKVGFDGMQLREDIAHQAR